MTSVWEPEVYGIPYNMVDLMRHYLEEKCVVYKHTPAKAWNIQSYCMADDPSSRHRLELYNVNNAMWERVLKIELTAIAATYGHTLVKEEPFDRDARSMSFRQSRT